jgi:hypothetical protein
MERQRRCILVRFKPGESMFSEVMEWALHTPKLHQKVANVLSAIRGPDSRDMPITTKRVYNAPLRAFVLKAPGMAHAFGAVVNLRPPTLLELKELSALTYQQPASHTHFHAHMRSGLEAAIEIQKAWDLACADITEVKSCSKQEGSKS